MEIYNNSQDIYFNEAQLLSLIVDANQEYCVAGRGTGKSSRVLAPRSRRNMLFMPRSVGAAMGETFQQLLTRTLPSVINGWEQLGFVKDVHYVIGQRPPKKWKWPEPYEPPLSYKYFIACYNGSGIHLVSQDRPGSSNGLNLDWLMGDEAKYLNYDQFLEETLPAMRANRTKFGHLSYHHSICFTTSMPTAADAKWILKKEEEMDVEQIKLIKAVMYDVIELEKELRERSKGYHNAIKAKLKKRYELLNQLRKDAVYYWEASTLDNIHVLGVDYIRKMRRILPDFIWDTEILNKRPESVENGFYPQLSMEKHTYSRYNNAYLESLIEDSKGVVNYDMSRISEIDCQQDGDLIPGVPLWIAVDWGDRINCMSVAQRLGNEIRYLNAMHVKKPAILDDLAKKFSDYYRHHNVKYVNFAFDHTGHAGVANSNKTYAEQFADELKKHGWRVNTIGKRKAPFHHEKYLIWSKILAEVDDKLPHVRFNKHNCKNLLVSMMNAPALMGSKGVEKDKRSERKEKIPQEDATHYSDTADILLDAMFGNPLKSQPEFIDILTN